MPDNYKMRTKLEDKWNAMWQSYMDFMAKNKRRPSKYRAEDRNLVNWLKHNRQLQNKGLFPEHRKEKFKQLLDNAERYRRVNQYYYSNMESNNTEGVLFGGKS